MELKGREKIAVIIDWAIAVVIALRYTAMIDFSSIQPHWSEWLTLIFLWFFTVGLFGTPLFCLNYFLVYTEKGRAYQEEQFVNSSSLASIGAATAYTMALYFFGLTDSFFSFMVVYT